MHSLIQNKTTILPLLIAGVFACFAISPMAKAVVPPPDGGYPGFNTAEGQNALFSLTTGVATLESAGIRFGATPTAATTLLRARERSCSTPQTTTLPLVLRCF